MLQNITCRKMSPSLPARPTAAAPMARFWGEIILPEHAAGGVGGGHQDRVEPASLAASTCRAPNSALEEVSEPVTATPSQPMIGDRKAKTPPAPAIQLPDRRCVCPRGS